MVFSLDKRLEQDSVLAASHADMQIRLMNDSRYFWVILVPVISPDEQKYAVTELHELPDASARTLWQTAAYLGRQLKAHTGATKINTAAIGNIVSQIHLHIVARHDTDPAWPAPIWGHGTPVPLAPDERGNRLAALQEWASQLSNTV